MRTACALILATLWSMSASAQTTDNTDPQYDPPAWAMINDSLGHVLDLTNDQMKQVQEADEHYRGLVKAGDKSAMEKRDKDLQAILIPSQYAQWKEIAKKQRAAAT